MSQLAWGWDALTDLLSNLLGILILLSLVLFAMQASVRPPSAPQGEVASGLPVQQVLVHQRGVFAITNRAALEAVRDRPVIEQADGSQMLEASVPAAHGAVDVTFVASPDEDACLLLRPRGQGCEIDEVFAGTCPGLELDARAVGRHLVFLNVYPGGYEAFRSLCRELMLLGFEVSWKPRPESEPSLTCTGDSSRWVSGVRPLASQGCDWLFDQRKTGGVP